MMKRLEVNPVGSCASSCVRAPETSVPVSERNPVDSPNRKLIRPSFNELKDKMEQPRKAPPQKRPTPPDQTNAENFYYVKQMQAKTPMVITLKDGEVLKGSIEWYDRSCLKVNRDGEPNVLVYKSNIKYMHKDE
jgi:sRNA-binding regulator protein Hfq